MSGQTEEVPPSYADYPTELPRTFPIGTKQAAPLVNVTELQAHLRLIGAFYKLKQNVQSQEDGVAAKSKELAWVAYVNKAVYRFDKFMGAKWISGAPGLRERSIPPLDVVMVWHSYLLNPRTYYEDSYRMTREFNKNLASLESMPLTLISSLIDPQTLEPVPPSAERQAYFESIASLPFFSAHTTDYSDVLTLSCPLCGKLNHLVQWVAPEEKGYAQTKFEHKCESCGDGITKPMIGITRFAEEVTRKRVGERVFFSETLLNAATGMISKRKAEMFMKRVLLQLNRVLSLTSPCTEAEIPDETRRLAAGLKYDHLLLSDYLHLGLHPLEKVDRAKPLPRIQRITVAYCSGNLASLDLVGAILRQGSFIEKMVDLGWTQPGRFEHSKDCAPLIRSIARYHAFLDLMSHHSLTFFVPTLDIDLAWHSHQLNGVAYRHDTLEYIKRTPNHDDGVNPSALSTGYDITAKAWKERFGVPYSVCGCVPDPDHESRISRFTSKIIGGSGKKNKENGLPINLRPDLVTIELSEADSSHPSEHNLNFGDPNDATMQEDIQLREKVSQKCVVSAKKSKDPWRGLQAERHEKRSGDHKEAFTNRNDGHAAYYAYWGVSSPIGYGYYGGTGYGGTIAGCGIGCGAAGAGGGCGTPKGGGVVAGCGGGACGGCGGGGD